METVFSGVQPSGVLHLGNYLGAIKNWVQLQEKYRCVFCVVDLHALTVPQDPETFSQKTLEIAKIYLAAGLEAEKSIIFIQSHIKEHAELCWILNTIAKIPELERMTQFKEKAEQHKKDLNVGLFDYPVLMAADILLYQTDLVPVGEDQIQHVELARTLAERFNKKFGETFIVPKALVKKEGARIMGLDDPTKKMSKSAPSPQNYIALMDSPDTIQEKIKKAMTDSGKEIKFDPAAKPAISNLLEIYSLCSGQPINALENKYADAESYAEFKNDLAEAIIKFFSPFQQKFQDLDKNNKYVVDLLNQGSRKARAIASQTIAEVKSKIGLI